MAIENNDLAPGPWRLSGIPNYRNVEDANGAVVCSVAARPGGEMNALALAEAYHAVHTVRDALRVLTAYFDGDVPDISEASQVIDELASIVATIFGNANTPADNTIPARGSKRAKPQATGGTAP